MQARAEGQQSDTPPRLEQAWAMPLEQVLRRLDVDPAEGLSPAEARRRFRQYGPNQLRRTEVRSGWIILLQQFKSMVVIILAVAGGLSLALGHSVEGLAILAVIAVNGTIGFISEWRATRSMESLRKLGRPTSRVRRRGGDKQILTESIVPGEVVILEAGDIVPADMRLVEANGLMVDESAMTGESVPVVKRLEPVAEDVPLAERYCMLFKGTTVTEGSAAAVVTATGMDTELGRITELAEGVEEEQTPLEQRLERLGRRMAWLVLSTAAVIAVSGVLVGQPTLLIIKASVALGVAAIPEGLPVVANIALARGMWLMSRCNALINRLPAVETLGATGFIFTDKTGTLTENRMTLERIVTSGREHEMEDETAGRSSRSKEYDLLGRILETGVLCNNATLAGGDGEDDQGDPTEVALLRAGAAFGINRDPLLEQKPEEREESFDPDVMMMATFHRYGDGYQVAVKGAPGNVLDASATQATPDDGGGEIELTAKRRQWWDEKIEELAGRGLRVLAMAERRVDDPQANPYEDLCFLGLVGLFDPPKEGVRELIESCHRAGIEVVMVTGDQPQTAHAIGRQVGIITSDDAPVIHSRDIAEPEKMTQQQREHILQTRIFARVSPEQKLHLVRIFQDDGDLVAMTGDGINDAPALKRADIGIAMGRRGTDAAREASDMVLQDDSFSSIVAAVRQGRTIFSNIRKSVMFMLCTNVAEVLAVAACTLADAPLPLLPLQILYLNMVTDVFPALALSVGKSDPEVMNRPPRSASEDILTRQHWLAVGGWGFFVGGGVVAALALAMLWLGMDRTSAVTISFLTLAFAKLWFVLNLRGSHTTLLKNAIISNPWMWAAVAFCIILLLAAVYMPGLSGLLGTTPPGVGGWVAVALLSILPALAGQIIFAVRRCVGRDQKFLGAGA